MDAKRGLAGFGEEELGDIRIYYRFVRGRNNDGNVGIINQSDKD